MSELNANEGSVSVQTCDSVYGVRLRPLSQVFETHGFDSMTNGALRGISGSLQSFDMVARKGNQTITIDVLPSGDRRKSEMKLVNMRAKIWDCAPEVAIAISPVKSTPELKEMIRFYNLVLIEAENEQELEEKLEALLELSLH